MTSTYELYQTDTFTSDLKFLDKKTKEALKKTIYRMLEDPVRFKPLKGRSSYYRIRIGVYRLVYKLENKKITLLYFKKRDTVYKKI